MQFSIETPSLFVVHGVVPGAAADAGTARPVGRRSTRAAAAAPPLDTDCAIVPVFAHRVLGQAGSALDTSMGGLLRAALARGDLAEAPGSTLLLPGDDAVRRVLLVTVSAADTAAAAAPPADGAAPKRRKRTAAAEPAANAAASATDAATPPAPVRERAFCDAARAAFRAAAGCGAKDLLSLLADVTVGNADAVRDIGWIVQAQALVAREGAYRFDRLRSKREARRGADAVALGVPADQADAARAALERAVATADGVDFAKDLGNLPGNLCTPTVLADEARALARRTGMRVEVLERKQMEALRMGSLLAVAQGSDEPPKLIVLEWRGGERGQAPIALVGKGITFDSGGISIKPGEGMDEMKYDMSGAGAVLGTMAAIAGMKLALNVVAVIPATENMPSGRAVKPGDVVTSMSGQTIEILNTDAEGRLVLCDALTYVSRFEPSTVVDLATLTGACVVALGNHHAGLFTPDDALAAELLAAGRDTLDTCWRMPLDEEYQEQIKSPFADMANIGGRAAGAVTAACFLSRFAKGYAWAHLDIAGTAWKSGAAKGSTGRPVTMLTRFLVARAEAAQGAAGAPDAAAPQAGAARAGGRGKRARRGAE